MNHSVYVITSSAQSGKSIVSLGLMQMLKRTTPNVAFFKPLIENKNVVDNHIETILSHFNVNMNYEDAYSYSRSELPNIKIKEKSMRFMIPSSRNIKI